MTMTATKLQDDPRITEALEKARHYQMTPQERFEQKVSFVYSSMDEKSSMTREAVRELVRRHEEGRN